MLCWLAADRGADLARERGDSERATRWQKSADAMKAEILDKGVDERGRFRQAYENDDLDVSLLLLPIMGFLPPDDGRIKATVLAIADELTEDGLVLRYKVDTTDTGSARRGFTDPLAVAGERLGHDRRDQPRPRPVQEAAVLRGSAEAVRRGNRRVDRRASRELSPGVGVPAHRRRAATAINVILTSIGWRGKSDSPRRGEAGRSGAMNSLEPGGATWHEHPHGSTNIFRTAVRMGICLPAGTPTAT